MFFTPLDIQNAEFKKSMYGYSDEEVDVFLDKVMNDYQEMRKEIDDLQSKVSILNDGMKQYKNMESSLKETLIIAQQTAEEVREEAVKKADNIIKEAELKADEIVQGARYKLFELNQSLKELKIHALAFKSEYMSKLQSEMALLDQMVLEEDYEIKVDKVTAGPKPEEAIVENEEPVEEEAKETLNDSVVTTIETVIPADFDDVEIEGSELAEDEDNVADDSVEESLELSEETVEEILDEILTEDVPDEDVDAEKQEAINYFSSDFDKVASSNKDEDSFRNRLFRRRPAKVESDNSSSVGTNEYKARFIADLDSDDVEDSKRSKREEEKNGEIKKWFLDD